MGRIRLLAVGVVALALATCATAWVSAWVAGSRLSAPRRAEAPPPPPALGLASVRIESGSGSRLAAWIAPPTGRAELVVASHAVRGSRAQLLGRARFLRAAGYGVLLYDAQAHGESPGERITFGHLEALDARAAVAFARSRRGVGSVAFIGPSLAGASALLGPEPLAVDALVLEAVFPSFRDAVENRVAIRLGRAIAPFVAKLLLWQVGPRLGVDPARLDPIDAIGAVRAPVLLIAGERDRRTTLAESRALFAAAPAPKELWVVEGARHEDYHRHAGAEYERRVLAFLDRHLAGDRGGTAVRPAGGAAP